MTQLEDQAAEARDEAAERTEALDQREAYMGGHVADLEAEIVKLNRQLDAATELVSKVEDELDEANDKVDYLNDSHEETLKDLGRCHGKRLAEVEDERDGVVARAQHAEADRLSWMTLHDGAEKEVATLRKRIERADDMVSKQLLYCDQVLGVLRGRNEEIERETHGNAERM